MSHSARERQAQAAQWLIARAVNGTALTVHAQEHHALITSPAHPSSAPVRITYAGGAVHHNGTYLGILDGYEPGSGQRRIGQAEILTALNSGPATIRAESLTDDEKA